MTETEFEHKMEQKWQEYKAERNKRLHRFTVRALIIFACLGLTTAVTVGYVAKTSADNKDTLCAYQADLNNRIAQTEKFLRENPEGFAGIPAQTLRVNLQAQKSIQKSFSGLSCP